MTFAAFLAVAFLHLMAAISPGPAVLMSARTGVTEGLRTGFFLATGIGVGGVIWAMADSIVHSNNSSTEPVIRAKRPTRGRCNSA